ncbi:hypothetical protein [Proteiniclasticum sp. QWL-01]|uniref:hypothetical protein n=1 Tax=Proteiniclasticum sp. QWL-01 TaxID=3036945 RepID=UPI00220A1676|nr:hypothetical protein [Proteiniclasticum sp. QWL-01]UUM12314.1 hypothetical protein NQU17_01800 [Clostridiaceae bacterium HFYG-1003]WFF73845.1 hypothetical protein P6M73_05205 [Proteiniclasticum sp. QWL-01]
MSRSVIFAVLGAVLFLVLGAVAGLVIGAVIGGNFFTEFRMFGVQGYEATGDLGAILGGLLGLILGARLGSRIGRPRTF